jgi:hypothetical protein
VPTLANRIVDGNAAGNPKINLKGIAVGDGCIGNSVGTCGDGGDALQIIIDFYYGHTSRQLCTDRTAALEAPTHLLLPALSLLSAVDLLSPALLIVQGTVSGMCSKAHVTP